MFTRHPIGRARESRVGQAELDSRRGLPATPVAYAQAGRGSGRLGRLGLVFVLRERPPLCPDKPATPPRGWDLRSCGGLRPGRRFAARSPAFFQLGRLAMPRSPPYPPLAVGSVSLVASGAHSRKQCASPPDWSPGTSWSSPAPIGSSAPDLRRHTRDAGRHRFCPEPWPRCRPRSASTRSEPSSASAWKGFLRGDFVEAYDRYLREGPGLAFAPAETDRVRSALSRL